MTDNKNFENEAVELNDKKLEKVAGGMAWTCPKCGATMITEGSGEHGGYFGAPKHYCSNCGYTDPPQEEELSPEERARRLAEQILGKIQN